MAHSVISTTKNAHEEEIWACKWATAGANSTDVIVTGSLDSTIKLWRLNSETGQLEEAQTLVGHRMGILRLDVSVEHDMIASSGMEGSIHFWDLQTGAPRTEPIQGGKVECWGLAFRPQSTLIGTSAQQGKIRLFDINTRKEVEAFETRGKFITSVHFSANGKFLAAGSTEGNLYIFDLQANRLLHAIEAHGKSIRAVLFSPDSTMLASASEDGTIRLYEPTEGLPITRITGHTSWITSLDFSPDSARVASCSTDGTVRVWKTDKENLTVFSDAHDKIIWDVAFSPEGNKLISVAADNSMVLYRTPKEYSR